MKSPKNNRRRFFWLGCLLVGFAVVLVFVEPLFARAGGGQGYSGGGGGGGFRSSGGSSGGSRNGGGGYLIYLLFRLVVDYPFIGIPLILLIIGLFVYSGHKGKVARDSSLIRRGVAAEDSARMPQYVAAIRANDPAFDPTAFRDRVRRAFIKIQHAWSRQDLSDVRAFISDAVYERFSLQFDEQRLLGYRNQMQDVVVRRAHIAHAESSDVFDEISLRIEVAASDHNVDLQTGRTISGTNASGEFVEVWSFLRRRGAKTHPEKPGLMEGNCPNCGGPLDMNQAANCTYCGALLRSGQYDWVLSEITQQYEWEPRKPHAIPGVELLRQRDRDFNAQELEDRASVVFWRWVAADRLKSFDPLLKVALPGFLVRSEHEFRRPDGTQSSADYFGECAVGAVDLLGVQPAGRSAAEHDQATDAPLDIALVNVRWQGHRFTLVPGGKPRRGDKSAVINTLFVLGRSSTATTNADLSIASAHCPSCGAPETGGSASTCGHCGTLLNLGTQQWALAEVVALHSERGQELLGQLPGDGRDGRGGHDREALQAGEPWLGDFDSLTGSSAASTLQWMVHMTVADGNVAPDEKEVLRAAARRYGVPKNRLEEYIQAAQSGSLDLTPPATEGEARRHLVDMARTALADGSITDSESRILRKAGNKLGLSDADVKMLIGRTRGQMVQEAKQVLRQSRKQRH